MTIRAGLAVSLLLLALPAGASAQGARAAASPEYTTRIGEGLVAITSGDRARAIEAFRAAVQVDPARAEGVCLLAEAQRLSGDMNAALDGFQACLRAARTSSDPRWTARALHGVASTLERMPERVGEARSAWQEYVRFADGAAVHASPQIGRSRITAIDQVVELERVMVDVRQRIAEREAQRGIPR